jgi:hypothetical protein
MLKMVPLSYNQTSPIVENNRIFFLKNVGNDTVIPDIKFIFLHARQLLMTQAQI